MVSTYLPNNVEKSKKSGRELEIVNEILKCMNYKGELFLEPYFRHVKSFSNGDKYDVAMSVPHDVEVVGFLTKSHIKYQNGVVVRKKDFPKGLKNLKDLKGKHVIAFNNASKLLPDVGKHKHLFASYVENASQFQQSHMLLKKRVDAVIADGLIQMGHHKQAIEQKPEFKNIEVRFFGIFDPSPFHVAFKDKNLIKPFNECLKKLRSSGRHKFINKKYTFPYLKSLRGSYAEN